MIAVDPGNFQSGRRRPGHGLLSWPPDGGPRRLEKVVRCFSVDRGSGDADGKGDTAHVPVGLVGGIVLKYSRRPSALRRKSSNDEPGRITTNSSAPQRPATSLPWKCSPRKSPRSRMTFSPHPQAVGLVYVTDMVDIHEDEAQWASLPVGLLDLPGKHILEMAAID